MPCGGSGVTYSLVSLTSQIMLSAHVVTNLLHDTTPQIACMSALSGIVAVHLKDNSYNPTCLLNLDGDVCTFTYITTGVTVLIASMITVAFLAVDYTLIKPLHDVVIGSSLFLAFWQFTMSLTIQIRGDQATGAGFPGTSARKAAYAMAWMSMAFSLIQAGVTCILMYLARPKRKKKVRAGAAGTPSAVPNQSFFGNQSGSQRRR